MTWKLPTPTKRQVKRAENLGKKLQREHDERMKEGGYVTNGHVWKMTDKGL